jgi:hypothetical protein
MNLTLLVASYAAAVSTFSLALALKVFRVGDPIVEVGWQYAEEGRVLQVTVANTGRADVTVHSFDMGLERHEITRRNRRGHFAVRVHQLGSLPFDQWKTGSNSPELPVRISSNSMVFWRVDREAVRTLTCSHAMEEIFLTFWVESARGVKRCWFGKNLLEHFVRDENRSGIV